MLVLLQCLIGQNNSTELSNAIKDGMIEKALKLLNTDKDEPDCVSSVFIYSLQLNVIQALFTCIYRPAIVIASYK